MKKISQINWNRYKESELGKQAIALFDKICNPDCTMEDIYTIAKQFNPEYFKNISKREEEKNVEAFAYYNDILGNFLTEENMPKTGDECVNFFLDLTHCFTTDDAEASFDDIPQAKFKAILNQNTFVSMMLYSYIPEFFIPNLFVMQFIYLKKLAEKYDLELPEIPNRSSYKDRWLYYLDLCIILNNFAIENEIYSPSEFCAFLYDYELPILKEEIENEGNRQMPEIPSQAWILCGNMAEAEKTMKHGFWQANQLTQKGDLLLFYEKSPVKKLNSIWIAQEDGVVDPFFHYYSNTYIGDRIDMPDNQAITFNEFKNNDYFKVENRGKKGNFVSKNFQDVSGWEVTTEDYAEIKRMLEAKGFDTSVLPQLYEPKGLSTEGIEVENDVYEKLVTPLLEEMGWKFGTDFRREVEFAAGHGTTGHAMNKRPDYCLHLSQQGNKIYANVVIEAKYFMKNNAELEETFDQCLTYASWGQAKVMVICDCKSIRVYEQDRNGKFDFNHHCTLYRWSQMKNAAIFNELKRKLDI